MRKLVIVGNGGFAKEVAWIVERINEITPTWDFLGFIDKKKNDDKVIGDDSFVINSQDELYVSIAIGDSNLRKKIYESYKKNPTIKYANIIDPSVQMSNSVVMGEGNIICAGAIVTVDIIMGNQNIINLDCTVGHDVEIKNYVTINPSVNVSGNVLLNEGVNIGTGTNTIQGIEIGRNTIVGAGAVVNRDLPDNCTAVGIPAKVIKSND